MYRDLFGRNADPTGMATWSRLLANNLPRVEVANAIAYSTEFRTGLIADSYRLYLDGRAPDAAGMTKPLNGRSGDMTLAQRQSSFVLASEE